MTDGYEDKGYGDREEPLPPSEWEIRFPVVKENLGFDSGDSSASGIYDFSGSAYEGRGRDALEIIAEMLGDSVRSIEVDDQSGNLEITWKDILDKWRRSTYEPPKEDLLLVGLDTDGRGERVARVEYLPRNEIAEEGLELKEKKSWIGSLQPPYKGLTRALKEGKGLDSVEGVVSFTPNVGIVLGPGNFPAFHGAFTDDHDLVGMTKEEILGLGWRKAGEATSQSGPYQTAPFVAFVKRQKGKPVEGIENLFREYRLEDFDRLYKK